MFVAYVDTLHTNVRRSGHAATYSVLLDSILMFGGWPPSDELEAVATNESNSCPLYSMPCEVLSNHLLTVSAHRHALSSSRSHVPPAPVPIGIPTPPPPPPPTPLTWMRIAPEVMPRTRHGHHLVSVGHETFVIGGCYWAHGDAVAPQDMLFDHALQRWCQVASILPPRFCSAMAASPCLACDDGRNSASLPSGGPLSPTSVPRRGEAVYYFFGGLDAAKTPTNRLYRVWLPSQSWEEVLTFGVVPQPQFKSCLVADVTQERTAAQRREGQQTRGRIFHMDGFLMDTRCVKRLYYLDVGTGVWREVCQAPDLVRSQVAHVVHRRCTSNAQQGPEYHGDTSLTSFTVFGGMPSQKGKRFRSSALVTFDAVTMMWAQAKMRHAPTPGITAHVVVLLPSSRLATATTGPDAIANGGLGDIVSVSVGGNEDAHATTPEGDPTDAVVEENNLGVQTSALHLFRCVPFALKDLAAMHIHRMKIACHINASPAPRDALLDELF